MVATATTHEGPADSSVDASPSVVPGPAAGATPAPDPAATPPAGDGVAHHADRSPASPGTGPTLRPGLKLVVSLRPNGNGRYRAFVGLGAEGCDPVLRSVEVAELSGLLGMLPCLVEDAESRWQTSPRNPRLGNPPRGSVEAQARVGAEANAGLDNGQVTGATHQPREAEPIRKSGQGQLTLFG